MDERTSLHDTLHLIDCAKQGDENALDALFRRYLPRVRQIAALRLGKRATQPLDVDDVIQEALTEAFLVLQNFDASEGRFCFWLAGIVQNKIRMQARSDAADKRGGGKVRRYSDQGSSITWAMFEGREATPSQNAVGSEAEERLHDALVQLSPRHREVLIQRSMCEMSYREIAAENGFEHEGSARTLHSDALKELRAKGGFG